MDELVLKVVVMAAWCGVGVLAADYVLRIGESVDAADVVFFIMVAGLGPLMWLMVWMFTWLLRCGVPERYR